MSLPSNPELLSIFASYLAESGLSNVSIKNYASDLRHFLSFCEVYSASITEFSTPATVEQIFRNINIYLTPYIENQKATLTPKATTNRRLASIRRFATFLSVKYYLPNVFTDQSVSEHIIENKFISKIENLIGTNQTVSPSPTGPVTGPKEVGPKTQVLSTTKILEQFRNSLEKEKKTHSTVKNYLSDLNHFFLWTANQTPYTVQNLHSILSESQLQAYITYLKLSHTSTSVINRRQSSIKKLARFCFSQGYLPENPFEHQVPSTTLAPLSWLERLSHKPKKSPKARKSRLGLWYDKYTALPWTPYLNIALLILLTTGMAVFAYNQIITQARPSAAATALTPPRRQLSFQGRLTDTSGNPITTAVSVTFNLFDQQAPGGSELYTTNACSITPDDDGIFNTLIGDGTCGAEIPISVFTDNRDVYLEIEVGAETLTPRQQIATVGYALNSETLQGYPASASATINTVPVIDNNGDINIAVTSPSLVSTDGTFSIIGQSIAIQTAANSGGDVILQPDALGSGQILAIGGTTDTDSLRITNANLTTGALLSGYVGNDLPTGYLINLSSGASESSKFWVMTDGSTNINATSTSSALIVNQNGSGNIISASSSGVNVFNVTSAGDVDITGQYLINGSPLDLGAGSNWQRVNGALAPKIISDSINIGSTATSSAFVHLGGVSGENSFVNTGNFGVGTNNPTNKMEIAGASISNPQYSGPYGQLFIRSTDAATQNAGATIGLGGVWNDGDPAISFANISGRKEGLPGDASGYLTLGTTDNTGTMQERIRIDSTGEVGIGVTNPTEALDILGNLQFTQALMPNSDPGVAGEVLISAGPDAPPVWSASVPASSVPFSGITNGTNTQAAMIVDTGASLTYANSGTINASTLIGSTWAAPGAIGTGTPNSGAFTTLSATGLTSANGGLSVTGYATVSASLAVGYTNAPEGPGSAIFSGFVGIGTDIPGYELEVIGDVNITGTLRDNDDAGNPGQLLSSTGTGIDWIDVSSINYWQRNGGSLSPLNISDALLIGGNSTASAYVHFAGTAGDNSWINNGNFGIGDTTPSYKLDVTGDFNLTGALRDNGNSGTPGQILSSTGTGVEWIDNVATSSGSGESFWATSNGALYPINATWDVLVGGDSTASSKFAFMNVNSGVPTASISSGVANVNTYLTGDGTLATTNRNTLTIGNSATYDTTGDVVLQPNGTGNVGIRTYNPTYDLDVNGTLHAQDTVNFTSLTADRLVVTDSNKNLVSSITSANLAASITDETGTGLAVFNDSPTFTTKITTPVVVGGTATDSSLTLQSTSGTGTTDFIKFAVGSNGGTEAMRIINNGNVGIGDTSPASLFTVGSGDLFQVNSSGAIVAATGITSSGTITFSALGTGIVHSNSSGVLSSSAVDLASADVTGVLPIVRGGTNNSSYTTNQILIYDGTKIASSGFTTSSFETALTFSNGLTRTVNNVTWGGTLTQATSIDMNGNNITFTGSGNFGIGVASPSGKFDVSGVLVVDAVNGRVGIGTSNPAVALDIAGTTSTISNSAGDITFNSASDIFNFSGDSLDNILNATISGQLKLGNFPTVGLPTAIGAGSMIYDSTLGNPKFWDGTTWKNIGSFFDRTATGILYPSNFYDSINLGGDPSASASALIRLSTNEDFGTFFVNPVAIGFNGNVDVARGFTMLQVGGDILPDTTDAYFLGDSSLAWKGVYLSEGIFDDDIGGTQLLSTSLRRFTGGSPWNIVDGLRVGDTSNSLPTGVKLYVAGSATVSGRLGVVGETDLIGNVTIGGGTGKIDVGTVDPPYTINGEKFATYMSGMIGVKEEVMGKVSATEEIPGLGFRALLDLDGQTKGTDLWLFSKTTNIKNNMNQLAVLLTSQGQAKTWYELDDQNKILAIYSSTPTDVIYRLTAPRFDAANWSNSRTSKSVGFVIDDPDTNNNVSGTGLLNASISAPELIAQADSRYKLMINDKENKEVSSFAKSIIANLQVGTQIVFNLVADNLTIRTRLISPIADIDQLRVIDATISGTLYAENIKSKTVDNLTAQLDLLNEKYATASTILADLQNKYSSYDSLLGTINEATISGDPLALSPLATTSATVPSDLALDSINVHMILTNDILANGSVLAQSFSSLDTDLFIQPTGDKPVHILANLMTLYPDGKVVVNGDLLITGTIYANAIDTRTATVSGTLALGKGNLASDSAQLITLFDDNGQIVGSVDASGAASFGKLVTGGLIIAAGNEDNSSTMSAQTNSNTTIGVATIATGSSEITVANNKVTDNTLIYITPISNTDNSVLYVKSKQTGVGFTVAVPTKANQITQEISFNYWLVETK